jgi:hypothetical protein
MKDSEDALMDEGEHAELNDFMKEAVDLLMETISEKVKQVEAQQLIKRLPVAASRAVHEAVLNTDSAASSSDRHLALCYNPAMSHWLDVREGQCFKELFAYLELHRRIPYRQMLSQHFSKTCQPKEIQKNLPWTSLAACGMDNVMDLACGRFYVKLLMPYAFAPGDGFGFEYTSPYFQKKSDVKNYAAMEIITALLLLDPSAVRLNFDTALKPCDLQHLLTIKDIAAKLSVIEYDTLQLACGSKKNLSTQEVDALHSKAATFTLARAKTQAMFEPGHSDDEVIAVLYEWSKSKHFRDNTVIVSEYNPPRIWQQLARFVQPKGLRDVIRRNSDKVTLLDATPLQFRVHPDGLPVAADPSELVISGGGSGEDHGGRDTTEKGAVGGSGAPSWGHTWRGSHGWWGSKGWQTETSWDETRNRTGTWQTEASWDDTRFRTGTSSSGSANDPRTNWAPGLWEQCNELGAHQRDLPVAAVSLRDRAEEDKKQWRRGKNR